MMLESHIHCDVSQQQKHTQELTSENLLMFIHAHAHTQAKMICRTEVLAMDCVCENRFNSLSQDMGWNHQKKEEKELLRLELSSNSLLGWCKNNT